LPRAEPGDRLRADPFGAGDDFFPDLFGFRIGADDLLASVDGKVVAANPAGSLQAIEHTHQGRRLDHQPGGQLGLGLIADQGFLPYMTDTLDILWKVPVTTLAFLALHGSIVFILSAIIDRTGIAAAAFLGLIIAGSGIAAAVAEAGFSGARWVALLSIDQHPRIIRDYLFENTVTYPAEAAGFEVWASVVLIGVLTVVAVAFVRARYRRLA